MPCIMVLSLFFAAACLVGTFCDDRFWRSNENRPHRAMIRDCCALIVVASVVMFVFCLIAGWK